MNYPLLIHSTYEHIRAVVADVDTLMWCTTCVNTQMWTKCKCEKKVLCGFYGNVLLKSALGKKLFTELEADRSTASRNDCYYQ